MSPLPCYTRADFINHKFLVLHIFLFIYENYCMKMGRLTWKNIYLSKEYFQAVYIEVLYKVTLDLVILHLCDLSKLSLI